MSASLRPAGYAADKAAEMLLMQLLATIVYLILFVALTPWMELIGPGIAAVAAMAVVMIGMGWILARIRNPRLTG